MIAQLDRRVLPLLDRVGMDEHRERAAPDHEPRDESSELSGSEQIDFEHSHRVRTDRPVPKGIYPEFWDFIRREDISAPYEKLKRDKCKVTRATLAKIHSHQSRDSKLTFSSYSFPQSFGVLCLVLIILVVVDMYITSPVSPLVS